MAILTWQNVPVPDIGRSLQDGTRTAADLLSRAVNHATAGVGQIQGLQEAQRTAETQAADRFALEKMLSAQTPEQLQALQADRFGPAGDRMSPEMLLRADARGDVLRTRGLQERREAQAPEFSGALADAIRTGDRSTAERLLRSNPDAASVGPQFQILESFLTNQDQIKAQRSRGGSGKDPIRESWVQHHVGEYIRRAQVNPKLGEEYLNQFSGRDYAEITGGAQKLSPRQIDDGMFHLPAGAPGGAGGGGGARGEAPPNAGSTISDVVTRAMDQAREQYLRENPDLRLQDDVKQFEGKSNDEIMGMIAKSRGADPTRISEIMARLQKARPELSPAQVGATLSQIDSFDEENIFEWLGNTIAAPFGKSDSVDRGDKVNLDFNADTAWKRADRMLDGGTKGLQEEYRQLQKDKEQYQKDLAQYETIKKQVLLGKERGIDVSSLVKDQRPLLKRLNTFRTNWNQATEPEPTGPVEVVAEPEGPQFTPGDLNYTPVSQAAPPVTWDLNDPPAAKGKTLPNTMPEGLNTPPQQALSGRLKPPPPEYASLVQAAAKKYNLPVELLYGQIATESGWDPGAQSNKEAGGLMQIIPATAAELGIKDQFDPAQNIEGGAKYMRQLLDQFDGDVVKALAAYNAGPSAVTKARAKNGVPVNGETEVYVPAVLARAYRYREMLANEGRERVANR